jgi:hypothetical protein
MVYFLDEFALSSLLIELYSLERSQVTSHEQGFTRWTESQRCLHICFEIFYLVIRITVLSIKIRKDIPHEI